MVCRGIQRRGGSVHRIRVPRQRNPEGGDQGQSGRDRCVRGALDARTGNCARRWQCHWSCACAWQPTLQWLATPVSWEGSPSPLVPRERTKVRCTRPACVNGCCGHKLGGCRLVGELGVRRRKNRMTASSADPVRCSNGPLPASFQARAYFTANRDEFALGPGDALEYLNWCD